MIRLISALCLATLPALVSLGAAPPALASNVGGGHSAPVCGAVAVGYARCTSHVVTDSRGTPLTSSSSPPPGAYGPVQFHTGYNLPATTSRSQTIGIVDAYNDPTIQSDLNTYDSFYGLPGCTTSNGCLTVVNQTGGTSLPRTDSGWALEISLDVETAHEICQNCTILLVEATTNSFANLLTAVDFAASHATEVSMSWGGSEFSSETSYDSHFSVSGVVFTASSGDGGYGTIYPSASSRVVATGGTTLNLNADNTYSSESAWSGSGSGCSAYETANSWQTSVTDWSQTGCGTRRGVADVSADADPNSGAAVYDSTRYHGQAGWFQVGGTSLSSPLVAGVFALAGGAGSYANAQQIPYANFTSRNSHDVTTGSTGSCGTIMCNATVGYDGPTGLGTPNGTGGF